MQIARKRAVCTPRVDSFFNFHFSILIFQFFPTMAMPSEPEPRQPTVTSAPPPGRKFPCEKCGAKLDFDPASRSLQCPYCGHTQAIEPSKAKVQKHDLESALEKGGGETALEGRSSQVTCTACGAIVLLEDKVVTDKCPYCSTHLENKPEAAKAMIAPEGVIPFAITSRQAIEAYDRWLKGLWFAPNALLQLATLGQTSGAYVPFWTFDSMTYTHYTGQRGEDYTETETYTETNAQGQSETKTRQVTKTRWYHVSGEVQHFFQDIFICASKGVPERYAQTLKPRDLKALEAFRSEFLSGFKTERYTIGPNDGFEEAKQIMDGEIRELCRRNIGGDHQRVETVNTQHVGVAFKHILLPIWLASYRYQEKSYRVLVNGQTGQVLGDRPYSWVKIAILVAVILAAVLGAFLLFTNLAKGATAKRPKALRVSLLPSVSSVESKHTLACCHIVHAHNSVHIVFLPTPPEKATLPLKVWNGLGIEATQRPPLHEGRLQSPRRDEHYAHPLLPLPLLCRFGHQRNLAGNAGGVGGLTYSDP
jgi:DNA-directed RNA polymerase subunit RPC12/RpoP